MDVSGSIPIATNFIAGIEQFSANPYFDVNGYAIGYGNHYYEDGTPVSSDDDPIDQSRALEILSFYVNQNASAISAQLSVDQNADQLAALTSLRYNCGTITTALLNLINSGADPGAIGSKIEQTCTTSGGVSNPALIARRQMESALYQNQWIGLGGSSLLALAAALGVYIMFIKK